MKTIEKVEIKKLSFPVGNIYNYNAMIFRSVDGGNLYIADAVNIAQRSKKLKRIRQR